MRLLKLTEAMRTLVCAFDPFSILEEDKYSGDDAYGIIFEDEDGKEEVVGLLLIRNVDTVEPVIDWLYVAPAFRSAGFSDYALNSVFKLAEKNGAVYVRVCIRDFYGKELVCPKAESFLTRYGFTEDESYKGHRGELYYKASVEAYIEYMEEKLLFMEEYEDDESLDENFDDYFDDELIDGAFEESDASDYKPVKPKALKAADVKTEERTLGELEKAFSKDFKPVNPKPVPIGELSLKELESGIEEALAHKASVLIEDIKSVELFNYDPELSFAVKDGEDITGLILVKTDLVKLRFEVCLHFSHGKNKTETAKQLFYFFVLAAKKEGYPADLKVVFAV